MTDKLNPDYQRAVDDFVGRHVYYCVSNLVDELGKHEEYSTDILEFAYATDWESAAYEEIANGLIDRDEITEYMEEHGGYQVRDSDTLVDLANAVTSSEDESREVCEHFNIDPHTREVFEYWLVSRDLAHKLDEKGEPVTLDFLGLVIWGRTTTGQSIGIDRVICEIYDDIQNYCAKCGEVTTDCEHK